MAKTAADIAAKWSRNLGASTQTITQGVNSVTESPTAKAAQAVDRMVAGIQRAAADGRIARGLNAVSIQQWKDAMINKGVPRIASGATQAQPKVQAFMNQLMPYISNGRSQLANMPRGDENANQARMMFWFGYMKSFKKQG